MEGDDDELENSDCLPRLRTKCPCCIVILCARANPPRRSFEGGFISLSTSNCAAFIRGRRLFAEIWYTVISGLQE